ncbi:uncharacterized protein RCC_03106 [Ramularia collo-cygni]|uniref:Uncharacterized protein n=1 Tax=Ramularia collo-cygni TaxID=112498 RepID=A0A2D3UN50_9PEZI|nr:uncharacterized protein RCC_03106 [Ramularia collo-cygni]CZT17272.1 uncharacterized protein RCC_03106 [Ramularia collo-cygni]
MPPAVSWLSLFQEAKAAASTNVQESAPSHLCGVGQSFSAVEEAVNRRPAVSNVKYTAHSTPDTSAVQRQPAPAARRIGHVVPRVFTGSFSELEESMRKLQTPAAVIPPQIETASTEPNAKLASVTTPVSATTSSVNSSPGLRRREAIIERDVEFQDRLINGDIVRSRRPVECDTVGAARIPATDDSTHDNETITRWLNDPPSGRKRKVSKDAIKS